MTDPVPLRAAVVVRVTEPACEVVGGEQLQRAVFAPVFPTPHVERVSPGHVVALADAADGRAVVLWRWYDAVVVADDGAGSLRIWEPAHGEVDALARPGHRPAAPGSRVYASAGLPGAAWWVAGPVGAGETLVELDEVAALYTANDLWGVALGTP